MKLDSHCQALIGDVSIEVKGILKEQGELSMNLYKEMMKEIRNQSELISNLQKKGESGVLLEQEKEAETLKEEIEIEEAKSEETSTELRKAQNDLVALKTEFAKRKKKLKAYREMVASLKDKIEEKKSEVSEKTALVERMGSEFQTYFKKVGEMKEEAERAFENDQRLRREVDEKVAKMENLLGSLEERAEELDRESRELNTALEEMRLRKYRQKEELASLKKRCEEELPLQINTLRVENRNLGVTMEGEINETKARIQELEKKKSKLEESVIEKEVGVEKSKRREEKRATSIKSFERGQQQTDSVSIMDWLNAPPIVETDVRLPEDEKKVNRVEQVIREIRESLKF